NVQKDDLVGALVIVQDGQLDGVARVAEVHETGALDDAAGGDVEAGDQPAGEHRLRGGGQEFLEPRPPLVQGPADDHAFGPARCDAPQARDVIGGGDPAGGDHRHVHVSQKL